MSNRPFILERFQYWQGQKLLGRDFRDQLAREAQLRWWHNRALHKSYGVSYGFQVSRVIEAGEFVAVRVTCGVAYDCFGRELIQQDTRDIRLPADVPERSPKVTLVATYKESWRCGNECTPVCACRTDEPLLQWRVSRSRDLSDGVPLLEVSYEPSASLAEFPSSFKIPTTLEKRVSYDRERKLLLAIDGLQPEEHAELLALSPPPPLKGAFDLILAATERSPALNEDFSAQQARALARPRIGRGATVPGNTSWEEWSEILADGDNGKVSLPVGVQVTIDTSSAGFTQLPCYFAWLQGSLWNKTNIEFFPVPLSHIDHETTTQFRFRAWMPPLITVLGSRARLANATPVPATFKRESGIESAGFSVNEFVNFARQQRLYVCWIGIQEQRGQGGLTCEPLRDCECVASETDVNHQQESARN
ncbi:MAG: hypothetical protein ND895_07805 [Pyrinomonadaceae bacterium]|nr:hypothetical protein [Pyrinomonadaceae bacterium]